MSKIALIAQFQDEGILSFKQNESKLLLATNRDGKVNGAGTYTWVVANEEDAAVTRNINGDLPYETSEKTQYTATLNEWHGLQRETGFNIFESQATDSSIMRKLCMRKLARKIDETITTELESTSTSISGTQTMSEALIQEILATLGESNVLSTEGDIFASVTPSVMQRVLFLAKTSSIDYVDVKTMERDGVKVQYKNIMGINWINNTQAAGMGTATSTNVVFHRDAIGFAAKDKHSPIMFSAGFDGEHERSWCKATGYFGAKLLEVEGALKFTHNDTASY